MLRTFEKSDWNAFAGASELPNGSKPLIGEIFDWIVIVSGDERGGVDVQIVGVEGDVWNRNFPAIDDAISAALAIEEATLVAEKFLCANATPRRFAAAAHFSKIN